MERYKVTIEFDAEDDDEGHQVIGAWMALHGGAVTSYQKYESRWVKV